MPTNNHLVNLNNTLKNLTLIDGDKIPALGLGTWKISPEQVGQVVTSAIHMGYRHIDCARIYNNEAEIGSAFNQLFSDGSNYKRDQIWVTSKLWNNSHRAEHVRPALEKTLTDLQLDHLDLYLMHWPVAINHDVMMPESGDDFVSLDEVPLMETWQAMEDCAKSGLCRNIGVSNFNRPKLQHLIDRGTIVPAVNQVESHPLLQQNDLLEFCNEHNIAFTAYSPLGSGDRPDHMRKDDDPNLFKLAEIVEIADRHSVSPPQIMLAWAVQRGTIAIPKSTSDSHLQSNLAAEQVELSELEMQSIFKLDEHRRFVDGSFWEMEGSGYTMQSLWNE